MAKVVTYLEDGGISIDNNVTGWDICSFTMRQKNWMFSEGATASANLCSLVMSCRANNINPYYYFALFKVLPPQTPQDDLTDFIPWNIQGLTTYSVLTQQQYSKMIISPFYRLIDV